MHVRVPLSTPFYQEREKRRFYKKVLFLLNRRMARKGVPPPPPRPNAKFGFLSLAVRRKALIFFSVCQVFSFLSISTAYRDLSNVKCVKIMTFFGPSLFSH